MTLIEALTGPTTELLQSLIRNECVNDGRPESGNEVRNADLLQTYLEGAGLDVARFESRPGRTSIVARIEGSEPDAPALCLMGHTDVVPVNPDGWSDDPFGGELIDGEVWGRGAIDMLNITSSMAVAFRRLATEGFRPTGHADLLRRRRRGGRRAVGRRVHGRQPLGRGRRGVRPDRDRRLVVRQAPTATRHVTVNVAEKGLAWRRLRVAGTPGHGSMPYGADNALITAAEVVRRLAAFRPTPNLDDLWSARLDSIDLPDDLRRGSSDPATDRRGDRLAAHAATPASPTPARTRRSPRT